MPLFDFQKTREQYLERLLARYGTITLPIASTRQTLSLQTVFQPMILRRDPLASYDKQPPMAADVIKAQDGADALSQSEHGRMVVLGGPGMGKTTVLKALLSTAIRTAQADLLAPLPLFISLPDFMWEALSFERYIQHVVSELEIDSGFASILSDAVHGGSAFLCLDSLDEVLPAFRPDVIAFLNQEALRCRGIWIIGSRFTEYKGGQFAHSQFAEWELQALDAHGRLTLARQLLSALYDLLHGDVAQDLKPTAPSAEAYIEELRQGMQIAAWGENPLLFSLAAIPYTQTGRLPASRALLYAQVTEAMFMMRIHDIRQRADLRQMLAEIALEFYQTHGRNFSLADALEFLSSRIPDQNAQSFYRALGLLLDSGVLEPVGYQMYGFKHQMFQEYLAAVALARRCLDPTQRQSAWELLWRKRRLSRWSEILRLLVGILVQEHGAEGLQIAHEWLSALVQEQSAPEGDPGNLCLILAMKSLDELGEHGAEPTVASLAQEILEIWEKTLIASFRQGGWEYALPLKMQASVLWSFNVQIVIPIIRRIEKLNEYFRKPSFMPTPPAGIGYSLPISILWYLFEDTSISFYACHTLRVLQTPAIIERLIALLAHPDGNWSVEDQKVVVELLGKIGEDTALSFLSRTWQDTSVNKTIRVSAAEALSQTEAFVSEDTFVAMLADQNASIRGAAFQALSKWQGGQAHADLFLSALQDEDSSIRLIALKTLSALGVSLPLERLQPLLIDEDETVGKLAWNGLHMLVQRVPPEVFLNALENEHERVRDNALLAVKHFRDQIPVAPLLAMLSRRKGSASKHIATYPQCIQALGLLGDRVPLEPLLKLLNDSDKDVRSRCIQVLKQLGDRVPPEPLLKLLDDSDNDVRLRASLVFTLLGVTLPTDILRSLLDHSSAGSEAVQALAAMGANAPIASLLEIARARSFWGAYFAAQTLRLLHRYVPTRPILELLQNEEIRESSTGTYGELLQLLLLRGVDISPELFLPALKIHAPQNEIDSMVALLSRAGSQAPIEALLSLINEESRNPFPPKWTQQLFYILYEWVSPAHLTNALGNTSDDQRLAVSLLSLVHDEECIQLLSSVAQDPTRDRVVRAHALIVLSELGVNSPVEYLLQATSWNIEGMGYYLADTVERLGEKAPVEQLLPLLGEDHNRLQPGVVEALVRIARHIPPETVLPLLEDNNKLVRHAAIRILGAMGERASFQVFVALIDDPEQTLETCSVVLSALAESSTPAAAALLFEVLQNGEPGIKRRALWALRSEEWQSSEERLKVLTAHNTAIPLEGLLGLLNATGEAVFDGFAYTLAESYSVVKPAIDALGALGHLGFGIPVEPLLALLDHEDEYVVQEAAEALCKFGERVPVEALVAKMRATDQETVRDAIFNALSTLETRIPQEVMLTALSETGSNTLGIGGWNTLGNLARSMPEQILQRFQDDPRPTIRQIVLKAIQTTRACEWLPLVLATLDDADDLYTDHYSDPFGQSNNEIRFDAIRALGALNACAPIEPLLQLLHTNAVAHDENNECIVVLEALKQFGSRVPLTALLPLLSSSHQEIARLAFKHLQEYHPATFQALVPDLKAILRGEPVRGAFAARMASRIAETVALMGRTTPAVLKRVIELLDHPFWEVRERAVKTLGVLRRNIPDSAIRRLLELRKDPESPYVRVAANQSLAEILSMEQGMEDEEEEPL